MATLTVTAPDTSVVVTSRDLRVSLAVERLSGTPGDPCLAVAEDRRTRRATARASG